MKNQNQMRSKVENPFTGSKAELEQVLDEHQSELEKIERDLHEVKPFKVLSWL